MKFSMVVPVYNVEAYLPRCIESLINQTHQDIEIILVDDGSPDNCPKICDDYAKRDARIKVIHQKNEGNGGASGARNKGLQKAVGNYVWFIDADDYIELDACEKFARYAEKGYDILLGDAFFEGWTEWLGRSNVLVTTAVSAKAMDGLSFLKKTLKKGSLLCNVWFGPYRRGFLLENKLSFQSGISFEDFEFTPRAFLKAGSVICTRIPCYHYVRRENSQMTQKDQSKISADVLHACRRHEARFRNLQDEELRRLLMSWVLEKALDTIYRNRIYHCQKYIGRDFFKHAACTRKERLKSGFLCISPRLYCCASDINRRFRIMQAVRLFFKALRHPGRAEKKPAGRREKIPR